MNSVFNFLLCLILISLFLSQFFVFKNSKIAFYSPFSRFWEFGIGAILSFNKIKNSSRNVDEILGILGLILIAVSLFIIKQDNFPGLMALIPCLGAALVIFSGQKHNTLVSCILSKRFLVFIGLISYSLYLWHYPIIIFYQEYSGYKNLSFLAIILIFISTIIISYLSWRFIELSFRSKKNLNQESLVFKSSTYKNISFLRQTKIIFTNPIIIALICSSFLVAISSNIRSSRGWLWRLSGDIVASDPNMSKYSNFGDLGICITSRKNYKFANIKDCTIGRNKENFEVAEFGDSHGGHYANSVLLWANKKGLTTFSFAVHACNLLLNIEDRNKDDPCVVYHKRVKEILHSREHIKYVFIANRWSRMFDINDTSSTQKFKLGLEKTIQEVLALNKKLIILGEVPEFISGFSKNDGPPECIKRNFVPLQKIIPRPALNCNEVSKAKMPQIKVNQFLAELTAKYENVVFFDPIDYFCDKNTCYASKNNKTLYSDGDHLNVYGSEYIGQYFNFK